MIEAVNKLEGKVEMMYVDIDTFGEIAERLSVRLIFAMLTIVLNRFNMFQWYSLSRMGS